jgi:hypothetical protein
MASPVKQKPRGTNQPGFYFMSRKAFSLPNKSKGYGKRITVRSPYGARVVVLSDAKFRKRFALFIISSSSNQPLRKPEREGSLLSDPYGVLRKIFQARKGQKETTRLKSRDMASLCAGRCKARVLTGNQCNRHSPITGNILKLASTKIQGLVEMTASQFMQMDGWAYAEFLS